MSSVRPDHDAALDAAWALFCDRLKDAGRQVFKRHNPSNDLQRADGFQFLTQNLGQAFDLALETRDPAFPALHAFCGPSRKLGSDNADFVYLQAWIDGSAAYKIIGNRGSARFFNITVQGPRPMQVPGRPPPLNEPFGDTPEANLFGPQLQTEYDGAFVLYIGGPKRDGNWLPTTPGTRKLFIRQGFDAWSEESAQMRIERVGMDGPRPRPDVATVLEAIDWAGNFMTGVMDDWPDHPLDADPLLVQQTNRFPHEGPGDSGDAKRGRVVKLMRWQLAPDEALVVEFDDYDGFWMFTNMGSFMNSMDYLYRQVSLSPARAAADADRRIRLVISHDDLGFANWLDTQRFEVGYLCFRNLMSSAAIDLRVTKMKAANVGDHLPADTKMVTPIQRTAQLHERFNAIRRRYRV